MQQDTSLVNVLYALADGLLKLDAAHRESSSRIEERLATFDHRLTRLERAQSREERLYSADDAQGLPQKSTPRRESPIPCSQSFPTGGNAQLDKSDVLANTLASMQKELQALRSRNSAPREACPSVLSSSSNASRVTSASDGALRTGLSSSTSSTVSTLAGLANAASRDDDRARDESMQAPSNRSAMPRGSPPPKAHSPPPPPVHRHHTGKPLHQLVDESPPRPRSGSAVVHRAVPQTEPRKSSRHTFNEHSTVDQLLMDVLRGGGGGGGGGGAASDMKHAKKSGVDVSDWMANTSQSVAFSSPSSDSKISRGHASDRRVS